MTINDILRLYKEFERYDNHKRDYPATTHKMERFNDYLNKLKSVCSALQVLLFTGDIDTTDKLHLTEYELDNIGKAAQYFMRMEKRNPAPFHTLQERTWHNGNCKATPRY